MGSYVMALDQGTTSSRSILFDERARAVASSQAEFPCIYPQSGWVEQEPEAIWESQRKTMVGALQIAGITMDDVAAIGITNQRETTIAWNKETGKAVGRAIVWQCRRTAAFCDELKAEGFDAVIRERSGLVTDAYFSGTKMRWMLENLPEVKTLAEAGKLAFGTVDSWLVWKLTAGKRHVIDASNASRTMLYDIKKGRWDEEIAARLAVPLAALPEVVDSCGVVGETDPEIFGAAVPIAGIAGDQQAALFGQACFEPGMAKNTYGTGCFLLMNTGETPVASDNGLLTTIAWQMNGKTTYALEGAVFIGGAVIQWLRDGLELFENAAETQAMAEAVPDSGGVYLVPAFVGLGAPHWDAYARGAIVGLTRDTSRNHLVRAALEAVAFQSCDVLQAMTRDAGIPIPRLRVDGGASANDFLCQFQADLLGCTVSRPEVIETTAMGAAFLAGIATGFWDGPQQVTDLWNEAKAFEPKAAPDVMKRRLENWHRAVERAKGWIVE